MKSSQFIKRIIPFIILFLIFTICVTGIILYGRTNSLNPSKTPDKNGSDDSNNDSGSSDNKPNENNNNSTEDIDKNTESADGKDDDKDTSNGTGKDDDSKDNDNIDMLTIVDSIIDNMSMEEKVGQLFFVRCEEDTALEDIKQYHLGGLILFANNFKEKNKKEVTNQIISYQSNSQIPLLIGIDEEGGTVVRVSKFKEFRSTPFLSPRDLYNDGGMKRIIEDTYEKSDLLKHLGINVNLAPVSDITIKETDYMYSRSFGVSAGKTADYVSTVVTAMNEKNIGVTLKHFPGYGDNVDTHTGIANDKRSYETFLKEDFLPFQAGIKAGAGSVLVSHNIVESMDKDLPASLSKKVHEILREELAFSGVIMTDDLSMDAITTFTEGTAAAVLAVLAGNDLIIASDYKVQVPAVIAAVQSGKISEKILDKAVERILTWKYNLGLLKK